MIERIGNTAKNFCKYFITFFIISCTSQEDIWWDSTIDINPNLPIDNNGFYHMQLDLNSKKIFQVLEGYLMDSPVLTDKPIEFDLVSTGDQPAMWDPKTHPRQQKFQTIIFPTKEMQGDTLTLTSRVFIGIDASGEDRYATNITNIILD